MDKKTLLLGFVFGLLPVGTLTAESAPTQRDAPLHATVSILGALVGPTKIDGKPWDSSLRLGSAASAAIGELGLPGTSALTASLIGSIANQAPQGKAAPDVVGYVRLEGTTTRNLASAGGTNLALADRRMMTRDSYTPRFYVTYQGWTFFPDNRLRVHLWDRDLQNHDSIAVVEITYQDIIKAIEVGKPIWVNVADQSLKQLLYVQISASKAPPNTRPELRAYRYSWQ